jgi:hypothetical protein
MLDWENRFDVIVAQVCHAWVTNGRDLDDDTLAQTIKTARDAVNNVWCDGMSDAAWRAAALQRLGVAS